MCCAKFFEKKKHTPIIIIIIIIITLDWREREIFFVLFLSHKLQAVV